MINESQNNVPPIKKRSAKSKKRLILYSVALVLILAGLCAGYLIYFFKSDSFRVNLEQAVAQQSGLLCSIDAIDSNLLQGGLTARGITLKSQSGELLLHTQKVMLKVATLSALNVLWGGTLHIEKLIIDGGKVNSKVQYLLAASPSSAKEAPTTSDTTSPTTSVDAQPERANKNMPTISFDHISARNLNLLSPLGKPLYTLQSVQISAEPSSRNYFVRGRLTETGAAGEALVEGTLNADLTKSDLTLKLHEISLKRFYANLNLPRKDLILHKGTCKGRITIQTTPEDFRSEVKLHTSEWTLEYQKHQDQISPSSITCSLRYNPSTANLQIIGLQVLTAEKAEFACSFNFQKLPSGEWNGKGKLQRSKVPWDVFCRFIQQPQMQRKATGKTELSGNFDFTGKEWEFSGDLNSEISSVNDKVIEHVFPASLQGKLTISTRKNLLKLQSAHIANSFFSAKGNLLLPLVRSADTNEIFQLESTVNCDLSGLNHLHEKSRLNGLLTGSIRTSYQTDQSFAIQSDLHIGKGAWIDNGSGKVNIGKTDIQCNLQAKENFKKTTINSFLLQNPALLATIEGKLDTTSKSSGKIVFRSRPDKIYTILSAAGIQPPEIYKITNALSCTANLVFSPADNSLKFSQSKVKFESTDANIRSGEFNADISWTPGLNRLSIQNASGTVINDSDIKTTLKGRIDYAPQTTVSQGFFNCDITARGLFSSLNPLLYTSSSDKPLLHLDGSAAMRIQAATRADGVICSAAVRAAGLKISKNEKLIINGNDVSGTFRGKYRFPQKQLTLNSANFSINKGELSTKINALQLNLHKKSCTLQATLSANIEKTTQIFPTIQTDDFSMTGLVKSDITLNYNPGNKSSLSIAAQAPSIGIFNSNEIRKIEQPNLKLALSWGAKPNKSSWYSLDSFSITTKKETIAARGNCGDFQLKDNGIVFTQAANIGLALRGSDLLLQLIYPKLTKSDSLRNAAYDLTAKLNIQQLPLNSHSSFPSKLKIYEGNLNVYSLALDKLLLQDVKSSFSFDHGLLSLNGESKQLGGIADYSFQLDLNRQPIEATAEIRAVGIELKKIIPTAGPQTRFEGGTLFLPRSGERRRIKMSWKGKTVQELLHTLDAPYITLHGENIKVHTKLDEPRWKALFEQDMPDSMANEMARRMSEQFANRYKEPIDVFYKYLDAEGVYKNGKLTIHKCLIGGGNTSDFEAEGTLYADGSLKLRVYPVGNMHKTFDVSVALTMPGVGTFLEGLPASQKQKAQNVLPQWLEQAAKRKSFYIDVSGNAENRVIDLIGVRNGLKKELPNLIKAVSNNLGEDELLKGVIGDDNFKKINSLLKNF